MAVSPVASSGSLEAITIDHLVDDSLISIFKELVLSKMGEYGRLSLVCRRWHAITKHSTIGRALLSQAGLPFPSKWENDWPLAYRVAIGAVFRHREGMQTHRAPFPDTIDISKGRVVWVEDRGFVFYKERELILYLFGSASVVSTKIKRVEGNISALHVNEDLLVCACTTGKVFVFDLDTLQVLYSYRLSEKPATQFFSYGDGWISIAEGEIQFWNDKTKKGQRLYHVNNFLHKKYQLFNHQLFYFSIHHGPGEIAGTMLVKPCFYALNLLALEKGPSVIEGKEGWDLALVGWGPRIGFYESTLQSTMSNFFSYTLNPEHRYEGGTPFNLGNIGHGIRYPSYIFRGETAFVITDGLSKDETAPSSFYEEDVQELNRNSDCIQLIDFMHGGLDLRLFVHSGIGRDSSGHYVATVMENRLLYFLQDSHEVEILEFPLHPEPEPVAKPPPHKKFKKEPPSSQSS